jgi:DNA polymerase-3 subunit gamma/tau
MDAASNNSVDDVRELREALRFRPAQARQKVFILDECHMLSGAAFNALLKTLEEPPPHVTFILATTEIRKVPVTVLSRCQRFDLRRVDAALLVGHLDKICRAEGIEAEEEALAAVARAAEGSVRDSLSILDQAIAHAGGRITLEEVRSMLGLSDRARVIDLFELVMKGDIAGALTELRAQYDAGADPAVVLSDLAEFSHLVTRLKLVPDAAKDSSLSQAERVRGADFAQRLSIRVLARAWQMLLKAIGEVRQADRPVMAAEMALVRLAHAADLPTPDELVKRLTEAGADAAPRPTPGAGGGSGGLRAMAGGGPVAAVMPLPTPELPQPREWREVVALASGVQPMLHANLLHYVHPVRIAPGRVEIRPEPSAPRDLAAQLTTLLADRTGTRWTVTISNEEGEPTLAAQGRSAESDRLEAARTHPLVQAILAAFPGTTIEAVRDAAADDYGLLPTPAALTAEPDDDAMEGRDFAPPEAETAWSDDEPLNDD